MVSFWSHLWSHFDLWHLTWKILKYKPSKGILMPTFLGLWDRLDVRRTGWQSPCIQEHSAAKMATSDVLRIKVQNQSRRPTPCSITTHLQSCSLHNENKHWLLHYRLSSEHSHACTNRCPCAFFLNWNHFNGFW